MLFSTKRFQPICLPCSLAYLCLLHNLSVSSTSSLSACLTQACLSVWSQDISRGAAAVRLRTRGTRAVGLIANIVEIFATHKNNKVRLLKKSISRTNRCHIRRAHSRPQYTWKQTDGLGRRYTKYPPGQAFTSTLAFHWQQLLLKLAQTGRVMMPSWSFGWLPLSQMGACVPQ